MDKFGVTLLLPECAFAAELQRESILDMMQDIDDQLDEQGAPDEPEMRCELMVDNAVAISHLLAQRAIDHEAGVADIAYSFIYVFGKTIGFEQIDLLRGLTGTFLHNRLNLNPCLGSAEYDRETMLLQKEMAAHIDGSEFETDPDSYYAGRRPSLH